MPKATKFAVANKILQKYENDRLQQAHKLKLSTMRPGIDNSPPKTYPHLMIRLKKLQKEEERQSMIEHDNRLLLDKIDDIMLRRKQQENKSTPERKSLNMPLRERVQQQIADENYSMGKRLGNIKPMYNVKKWEHEYKRSLKYKKLRQDTFKEFENITPRQKTVIDTDRSTTNYSQLPSLTNKKRETTTISNTSESIKFPQVHQQKQTSDGMTMAEFDAKQLFRVAKGLTTPDEIIIKCLARRSHHQRMQTNHKFSDMYDLDLMTELKHGLGPEWHLLVHAFLTPSEVIQMNSIHMALENKSFPALIRLLTSCDVAEKIKLNELYKQEHKLSIEEDITDRTSGLLQMLLVKVFTDVPSDVDQNEYEKHMKELMNPQEYHIETRYKKLTDLLQNVNISYVIAVLVNLQQMGKLSEVLKSLHNDLDEDIPVEEFSALIYDSSELDKEDAVVLYNHLSPTDPIFVQTLVKRAEGDMSAVQRAYKKKYGDDLVNDLREQGSHTTLRVLVELCLARSGRQSPIEKRQAHQTKTKPQKKIPPNVPQKHKATDEKIHPFQQKAKHPLGEAKYRQQEQTCKEDELEEDCIRIHNASNSNFDTVLIDVLASRNNCERQKIRTKFHNKYKQDLIEFLHLELSDDFKEIVTGLLLSPVHYDVYCLHRAIAGLGTDESTLIDILCTRSAKELASIKDLYKSEYGKSLVEDLRDDTRGPLRDLLLALLEGNRDSTEKTNKIEAKNIAANVKKTLKSKDYNISVIQHALLDHSFAQTAEFLRQYKQVAKRDIKADLKDKLSGDVQQAYLTLVRALEDPVLFYAVRLHDVFKGLGTDDETLIRICVSRSQVDLYEIKSVYEEIYCEKLRDEIESECSGSYKKLLLALIGR